MACSTHGQHPQVTKEEDEEEAFALTNLTITPLELSKL